MCSARADAATSPFFRARLCSASRCLRLRPVCPMYTLEHPSQGTLYTTPFRDFPSGHPRREMDDQKPRITLTLPYIAGLSEAVRRILAPLEIKAFRPQSTLRSLLVHPKDPVPMDQRKGVVYSVPCDGCSKVYIGQTGRSLKHRLAEHRRALKNGDVAASALAEHTLATGHLVDLTKSEVIDCHPYATTRCLLESWHIQRNPDALNREKGTLPEVYTALLE